MTLLTASFLKIFLEQDRLLSTGNVCLALHEQILTCKQLEGFLKTRLFRAREDVMLAIPKQQVILKTQELVYNAQSQEGFCKGLTTIHIKKTCTCTSDDVRFKNNKIILKNRPKAEIHVS